MRIEVYDMTFIPRTGSFDGMKSLNKSTILNMIRLKGPISRAQIAKLTKLTPPTVGTIVGELLDESIVIEKTGTSKTQGGRKPLMLTINSSAFYVIGVYAAAEVINTIITTLDGEIVYSYEQEITKPPPKIEFLQMLKDSIQHLIAHTQVEIESIMGIGVGVHGLVNPNEGIVVFSPHLNLENIQIKEELEQTFNIAVFVENDVRTLALAESWYGEGKNVSNYICLSVGLGIGSGMVIDGRIYNGIYNTAGEIGHTIVDVNGPRCSCGNYGCLEAYASENALLERIKKGIRLGRNSTLSESINSDNHQLTIEMVLDAANQGDLLTLEILEETGRVLGIAIANFNNLFTPSKVILEGRIFQAGDVILSPLKQMVKKSSLRTSPGEEIIVCSKMGKKGMVIGAITLVLRQVFKDQQV
jgi:N-acetylglucosamine repressor